MIIVFFNQVILFIYSIINNRDLDLHSKRCMNFNYIGKILELAVIETNEVSRSKNTQ